MKQHHLSLLILQINHRRSLVPLSLLSTLLVKLPHHLPSIKHSVLLPAGPEAQCGLCLLHLTSSWMGHLAAIWSMKITHHQGCHSSCSPPCLSPPASCQPPLTATPRLKLSTPGLCACIFLSAHSALMPIVKPVI